MGEPLFPYWGRHLLLALRDYLHQCPYALRGDITLEHVYIEHSGDRRGNVTAKTPAMDGEGLLARNAAGPLEQRLLKMFSNILLEMLYTEPSKVTNLQRLRSDLKCLLHTTANALDTYERGVMNVLGERPGQDTAQEWAKPNMDDVTGSQKEEPISTTVTMTTSEAQITLEHMLQNPYFAKAERIAIEELLDAFDKRYEIYREKREASSALKKNLDRIIH